MLDFTFLIIGGEKSCKQNNRKCNNKLRACAVLEQVFVSATESGPIFFDKDDPKMGKGVKEFLTI